MGCAVAARETSACWAFANAGNVASAAAPAAAPFRNLRRSIASFLDFRIVVSSNPAGRFYSSRKIFRLKGHLMPVTHESQAHCKSTRARPGMSLITALEANDLFFELALPDDLGQDGSGGKGF